MRKTDDNQPTLRNFLLAGGASGFINFFFKTFPDVYFIDQVANSIKGQKSQLQSIKQFWQTSKGAICWDFNYRLLMGLTTFPLQRITEQSIVNHYGKDQLTLYQKALIGSFTGWFAAMVEIVFAHPIDSMRVAVKKNPDLFMLEKHFGISYFLANQRQLRIGMGAGALRNTCSNPPAWAAKTIIQNYLENTTLSDHTQNAMTSLTFALVRFIAGYPLDVIKMALQCDAQNNTQHNKSILEKFYYSIALTKKQIHNEGFIFLAKGLSWRLPVNLLSSATQLWIFNNILTPKKSVSQNPFFWEQREPIKPVKLKPVNYCLMPPTS